MIARCVLLVAALWLGLAACSGAGVRYTPPPPAEEDNTLGPGDVFAVRVFGEQELSQDYRVAADGTIDFPYLRRLRVQGLEPTEVADLIRERLMQEEILRSPTVSVLVRETNSRRISVLGQVQRPGTFPFEQNMTIVQAITGAGGFTALAEQGNTRLTRRVRGGGQRSFRIPVDLITDGRIANVRLAPGDIIFVPERTF